MDRYSVFISRRADKFLSLKTDGKLKEKILDEISDLRNFPFLTTPHDLAKIKGRQGYYRLRVRDVRIIFRIEKPSRTIYVEKIDYRGSVYK